MTAARAATSLRLEFRKDSFDVIGHITNPPDAWLRQGLQPPLPQRCQTPRCPVRFDQVEVLQTPQRRCRQAVNCCHRDSSQSDFFVGVQVQPRSAHLALLGSDKLFDVRRAARSQQALACCR